MTGSKDLVRRPEARTDSVEDLVAAVLGGTVRIPVFQRGLAWESSHVLDLFDSIYRGFPVGSLLLRRAPAEAKEVSIGPLKVLGIETKQALWVVDGQQRLTSLVVGLGRPSPLPQRPTDPFVVYFDPEQQQFQAPPREGGLPSAWIPLPKLLNGAELTEWVFSWPRGQDVDLRKRAFEAGRRLREYKIPLYVIETDDEDAVHSIFYRVNKSGKPLEWSVVHDALFGHQGASPSTLTQLADELESIGMGRLDEDDQLLPSLVAMRGLDVTRSLGEHQRQDPNVLQGAAAEALPVLREVLSFLRQDARIPHLRLLPYSTPLVVLTRFFRLHAEPNERSRELLTRWIWRSFLANPSPDHRTLRRRGVAAIDEDEEKSVQALLELLPREEGINFLAPPLFDARSAQSRIALLGLASCAPMTLDANDPKPIDIADRIMAVDRGAFRPLFPSEDDVTRTPANRTFLEGTGAAESEVRAFIARHGSRHELLRSHAINEPCARAIRDGDRIKALEIRRDYLDQVIDKLGARLAGWGRNDRPSVAYVLSQVEA